MSTWARAELGLAIYGALSMLSKIANRLRARRIIKQLEKYGETLTAGEEEDLREAEKDNRK